MKIISEYRNLLETILGNARGLKDAGNTLLKASLHNRKLRPYAQFMLYVSIEECGKFLLILDQFPRYLSNKALKGIGFYSHEAKIKRLVTNIQKYEPSIQRNDIRIAQTIRNSLREASIYVDFENSKAIPPQFVKDKQSLNALASLVIDCIKFCEIRLREFKNQNE